MVTPGPEKSPVKNSVVKALVKITGLSADCPNSSSATAYVKMSYNTGHVETTIGEVEKMFPKKIHATNLSGFILKMALFLWAFQLNKAFI